MLAEYNSSGLNTSYSYGDDLISQTQGTTTHYYHYDGLGSTRALSDASGALTDTYAYDAFGELLQQTGTTENHYRFAGEQYDAGLDQYYLRARYYDQGVGRFTQQDTWMGRDSDPITLHKYLYANSDPANHTDPTGQFGLASFSVGMNIRTELSLMQVDVGTTLLDTALDPENVSSNLLIGLAVMGGDAAFKMLRLLSSKFRKACNSFDADTLISTEWGLKRIAEIKMGELVWAYHEETGVATLQKVIHLIQTEGEKSLVDVQLESGEVIKATAEHPFYEVTSQTWKEAEDLTDQSVLMSLQQDQVRIIDIEAYAQPTKVYNLTVANDHTYFVGRGQVLVHNANTCRFPDFDTEARNHILRGEISSSGAISGYHHRYGGVDHGALKVIKVTKYGKKGVYEGKVEYIDSNGNSHMKDSTFFPDGWTSKRVIDEINGAIINALGNSGASGENQKLTGKSPSGIRIEVIINSGRVSSAWPRLD